MPTSLEIYRDWENNGSLTTVHVLQIDRGDGSAANRLTLTDKPYVDKGVSGVRYHHTYPAPIHCIRSKLITDESMDRTTIAPIVLENGNGQFDGLRSGENIIGHRFTVLRGDQSWSLLETDFPYRFVEVFRGQIESVSVGKTVVLTVVPVKYALDTLLGSKSEPFHFGAVRNVPALLVDSASDDYRFTSQEIRDSGSAGLANGHVRDNGVTLSLTTDFTLQYESGVHRSKIRMVGGPPEGRMTADLGANIPPGSGDWVTREPVFHHLRKLIRDHLEGTYPDQTATVAGSRGACFTTANSDQKFYYFLSDYVYEDTASSPGDITTLSNTSSVQITDGSGDFEAVRIQDGGNVMRIARGSVIYQYDLSTPYQADTNTLDVSFDTSTLFSGTYLADFEVVPSEDVLYLLRNNGNIWRLDITAGDISTATNAVRVISLKDFYDAGITEYNSMKFSPDGKRFYVTSNRLNLCEQWTCFTAWEMDTAISAGRAFGTPTLEALDTTSMTDCQPTADGTGVHLMHKSSAKFETWGPIENYDLPPDLIVNNIAYEYLCYNVGGFYSNETPVGKIIADLLTAVASDFTIDRLGRIAVIRLKDPDFTSLEAWEIPYDIYLGDFIGEKDNHIKHMNTQSAKQNIIVRYDKNHTVQGEAEMAGSVSSDDKDYYSSPYETYVENISLTDYINPEDLVLDTNLSHYNHAFNLGARMATLWQQDHETYKWETNLKWQTLLSNFGIGSIIRINGDVRNPNFSDADRVLVTGRRVNWSDGKQTLTVFR